MMMDNAAPMHNVECPPPIVFIVRSYLSLWDLCFSDFLTYRRKTECIHPSNCVIIYGLDPNFELPTSTHIPGIDVYIYIPQCRAMSVPWKKLECSHLDLSLSASPPLLMPMYAAHPCMPLTPVYAQRLGHSKPYPWKDQASLDRLHKKYLLGNRSAHPVLSRLRIIHVAAGA